MRKKRGKLGLGVALGAAAAIAAAARAFVLHEPHLLWTMSGPALVYTTRRGLGEPARVLRTGGVYQSATYLGERRMEPVFEYYRAFGRLFELRPDARHVLAIGGGGFAFPKLVAARHPGVRMNSNTYAGCQKLVTTPGCGMPSPSVQMQRFRLEDPEGRFSALTAPEIVTPEMRMGKTHFQQMSVSILPLMSIELGQVVSTAPAMSSLLCAAASVQTPPAPRRETASAAPRSIFLIDEIICSPSLWRQSPRSRSGWAPLQFPSLFRVP